MTEEFRDAFEALFCCKEETGKFELSKCSAEMHALWAAHNKTVKTHSGLDTPVPINFHNVNVDPVYTLEFFKFFIPFFVAYTDICKNMGWKNKFSWDFIERGLC